MNVRLIALDLDDTLLHADLTISDRNREALRRAEEAGIKVVLASGRNLTSMRPYADLLGLKHPGDFLICSNGAELVAADTGEIVEFLMLPRDFCHEIAGAIEARGLTWMVYLADRIVCSRLNEWAQADARVTGLKVEIAGDRERLFAAGLTKFIIPGEPDAIRRIYAELGSLFAGRTEVLISKPYFLEILPTGADKGTALARLAARDGIPMSDVMAVGDAMNDLGMVRESGWGCAPANATAEVKAAARVVSEKTNNEDAVADLIERVALA